MSYHVRYDVPACINRESKTITRAFQLSALDIAYATLLYPPAIHTHEQLLRNSLRVAGVDDSQHDCMMAASTPDDFRANFTQWNAETRSAYTTR